MKIIINKTGKIEEVSAKTASRLINKGKAHFIEESVMPIIELTKEVEVVTEIDLIEPIPEQFVSFEEPKPKRKSRKKKGKFEDWKVD